ncbi:solute carrier family 13 member 2 isoform X1 [Dermochelys coriacea]|uniref:solute carrier family 13 member 2 isoform X1 n=1 Tax=Dermochelys coriacea TaxID=27794 RepID=UPI001CAA2AB7|nr:solute carrier family 13 member 2 isoform X1 [Dermochelys coriacea]
MTAVWRVIVAHRNYLIALLLPFLILPLPLLVPTKEARCGYVIILMALFWCMEILPLGVTALFPVVLFPLMNIMDSTKVCMEYLKDTNMLFIGGLMVAIAVEHWNLHKRIALGVLLIIGVRPALLIMGFMSVTAFLSMWISNTATTAMMIPIAQAVLEQLHKSEQETSPAEHVAESINKAFELQEAPDKSDSSQETQKQDNGHVLTVEEEEKLKDVKQLKEEKHRTFCKGMSLSVCYAASIGGIATLTGTTPNLVMKGQIDELFPANNNVVNFASWFMFAFPTMVLLLALSWIWLQIMFLGFDFRKNFGCGANASMKAKQKMAYRVIKDEHKKLGSMRFSEIAVTVLFLLLVVLWFTRDPGFMPGWATNVFNKNGKSYVTDATVVIFISLLMFLIPSEIPTYLCCNRAQQVQQQDSTRQIPVLPALLDWKTVNQKMPWNIVILLGGGFALAKGSEESGLSVWLGSKLTPLQNISSPAIALLLCLLVATFTECTSNVATTTLFLPILASMAQAICLNPLYVMLPCTLSASLAFMLPVATPPNAIAFSYGQLKVIDMAKAGSVLNIMGVLTIMLAINTWGYAMFDLNHFPVWANSTSAASCK